MSLASVLLAVERAVTRAAIRWPDIDPAAYRLCDRLSELRERTKELRESRRCWTEAETFDDLCELTAQWIEGSIPSQPGYTGTTDLDDAPGLLEACVALNRAGLMTTGSQEGYDGPGFDGVRWIQLASVEGFVPQAKVAELRERVEAAGFGLHIAGRKGRKSRWGVTVTWRAYRPYTDFGGRMSKTVFADYYGHLSDSAFDALAGARSFCIYENEHGANTLWAALLRIAQAMGRCDSCGGPLESGGDAVGG